MEFKVLEGISMITLKRENYQPQTWPNEIWVVRPWWVQCGCHLGKLNTMQQKNTDFNNI